MQSLAWAGGVSVVTAVHASHCTNNNGPQIHIPADFHRELPTDLITGAWRRRACGRRCPVEHPTATTWPPVRSLGAVGSTSTPPVAVTAVPRHVLGGAPIELPRWLWTHAWYPRGQPVKVGVDSDTGAPEPNSAGGPSRRGEQASGPGAGVRVSGCCVSIRSEGGVPLVSDARWCMGLFVGRAGGHEERDRRPCGRNRLRRFVPAFPARDLALTTLVRLPRHDL